MVAEHVVNYNREKVLIVILVGLSSACVMGLGLYTPQIYTSIVQYNFPNYTQDQVDAKASTYKSFMDAANAGIGLLFSPILGGLADVYGRKKIMIVGAISLVACIISLEIAYAYNLLWMTYVSCIFSLSMVFQICGMAFMSDISKEENEKSRNFGLVLAAYMLGIIFGSFVLGLLAKYGITIALFSLAAICVAMTIFLIFAFTERTRITENRKSLQFSDVNPFLSIKLILGMNFYVSVLVVVYAINFIALSDGMTSGFLYTHNRYGWGSLLNGVGAIAGGVSSMAWQAIGVGYLLRIISRQNMLTITMFVAVIVHGIQGFASFGWLYMTAIVISGFVSIGFPVIQSLISERIPEEKQGIAFGGLSGIGSIATFIGSLFTENVFSWCLNHPFITCPGTAFYICAFLFFIDGFICLLLFWTTTPPPIKITHPLQYNNNHNNSIQEENSPLLKV